VELKKMQMLAEIIERFKSKSDFSLLLVEDEMMVAKPMQKILERFCSNVSVAYDGEQGWELYQQKSFAVVVTDLQMPHMNGADLIEKIKQINPNQSIMVVTAFREGPEFEKAQRCGVDYILKKPFSVSAFAEALDSLKL
jgi:YesN/AraC family two-component response regulator